MAGASGSWGPSPINLNTLQFKPDLNLDSPTSGASAQLNYNSIPNYYGSNSQVQGSAVAPVIKNTQTQNTNTNNNNNNNNNNQNNNQSSGPSYSDQERQMIDAYNQMQQLMEGQKPGLENAYNQGLGLLGNQETENQRAYDANRQYLQDINQQQQGQLGQTYQDQIAQNRGIARAMGSYGSDYAQLQNKTGTNFQNNQMGLNTAYQGNQSNLMGQLQNAKALIGQKKIELNQNYNDALRQIALTQGQSDIQKIQALQQLQSQKAYMDSLLNKVASTTATDANATTGMNSLAALFPEQAGKINQTFINSGYKAGGQISPQVAGMSDLRYQIDPSTGKRILNTDMYNTSGGNVSLY